MTRALLSIAILGMILAAAAPAQAIPAFGRRYGVPCATCHSAITRRNEFGDAFRKAGYRWPGLADERAGTPPIEMQGVSAMRTLLPAWLPLAIEATMSGSFSNDPNAQESITLGRPALTMLFGGSLGEHVSVFGTWSGSGPPNEFVLQLARPWGRPELNLRVGFIEQSTTMFKTNDALISRFNTGTSALDGFALSTARMGAEVNGVIFHRLFWAAGVVEDAGVGTHLDTYYHVSLKLGGMDFLGNEPQIDLSHPSPLQDLTVTFAHWGYEGIVRDPSGVDVTDIRRFGLEAKLGFRDLQLLGGLMLGDDRNLKTFQDNVSLTWFAEATYPIIPSLFLSYMYQYQDAQTFTVETQRHDVGLIFLALENLRVRLKLTYTPNTTDSEVVELQVFMAF